jgi:hypothetical protein
MRSILLLSIFTIAACASPAGRANPNVDPLSVRLAYSNVEGHPALLVTMSNRTATEVCIRAELLRNPYTYAMDLRLRDSRGREVKREEPGFLPPPIMEPVRIAPGASVRGQYYLDARFKLKRSAEQSQTGMSAQAAFRYDACDGSQSLKIMSSWQRI